MKPKVYYILFLMVVGMACACSDEEEEDFQPKNYMPKATGEYGVRWSLSDVNDLGERCFSACYLEASIGIGDVDGASDFDNIYPWSDMERVEMGGDVFVKIPKFCVERYVEDGYEYRVISRNGSSPHPAFIEDGEEIDEIYVGAYEGYVDDKGLRSVPNVIPSSGYTPQEFLTLAQQRGEGYSLYDMRTVDLLFTLFAVEYGCRNSGVILGYGVAQYLQPLERQYSNTSVFYSTETATGVNHFRTKKRGDNKKISVGSNIIVCEGSQENILTFAKVTSITDSKSETIYYFDGSPIDVTTDCFIGNGPQDTNWTETCSAPLHWHTGRADMRDDYAANMRNPMRYRWVENIVGNVWHYLPDVTFVDDKMYVCENMRDYKMHSHESPYEPLDYAFPYNNNNGLQKDTPPNNFWVTSLVYDPSHPYVCFGEHFSSTMKSEQAFGAYYYRNDGVKTIANGGGFDHEFRCNILTNRAWILPTQRWYLYGARLIYKPIASEEI